MYLNLRVPDVPTLLPAELNTNLKKGELVSVKSAMPYFTPVEFGSVSEMIVLKLSVKFNPSADN